MPIRLHDSLTRSLKELKPAQADGVFRFYNCGPTVYAPAHIGNFRTFVINDVIRRLLELEHPGKVKHVRNLTDVDDKTIKRAREENRPLAEVTRQWTDKFHADCDALNCLRPHVEPAATGHIKEQVDMIDVLMKKGNAYRAADGSVYFRVSSFKEYGELSRLKERELKTGAALDSDEKEDGSDFALWKAHKPDDGVNSWDSPWGPGRPGWHIECSAMSKKHLGETIDLHTGGEDLLFPHHENEIAQSECCNGTLFAHHWYHSKHLLVDGAKMSKSLGNLYTLDDLREKGAINMAVRLALLKGHPRKQLNFSIESLREALLNVFQLSVKRRRMLEGHAPAFIDYDKAFAALHDDLNIPAALGEIFGETRAPYQWFAPDLARELALFDRLMFALGIDLLQGEIGETVVAPTGIKALAEKRWAAKQARDWAGADALRKELAAAGWSMLDGKDGYKLEPLKK